MKAIKEILSSIKIANDGMVTLLSGITLNDKNTMAILTLKIEKHGKVVLENDRLDEEELDLFKEAIKEFTTLKLALFYKGKSLKGINMETFEVVSKPIKDTVAKETIKNDDEPCDCNICSCPIIDLLEVINSNALVGFMSEVTPSNKPLVIKKFTSKVLKLSHNKTTIEIKNFMKKVDRKVFREVNLNDLLDLFEVK